MDTKEKIALKSALLVARNFKAKLPPELHAEFRLLVHKLVETGWQQHDKVSAPMLNEYRALKSGAIQKYFDDCVKSGKLPKELRRWALGADHTV